MSSDRQHPLFGTWRNTDAETMGVRGLAFEGERVRAWARGTGGDVDLDVDLGEGAVELFAGREQARPLAFSSALSLPGASGQGRAAVLLQGNINRGLMILAAYRFERDGALAGRFSREFYARRDAGARTPEHLQPGELFGAFERPPGASASVDEFVGAWHNTAPDSALPRMDIGTDLHVQVDARGRAGAGWPRVQAEPFAYYDELGRHTLLLLARFEHEQGGADLQIKVVLGTAVVAAFHRRRDGGSWFQREFFTRPRTGGA